MKANEERKSRRDLLVALIAVTRLQRLLADHPTLLQDMDHEESRTFAKGLEKLATLCQRADSAAHRLTIANSPDGDSEPDYWPSGVTTDSTPERLLQERGVHRSMHHTAIQ